MIENRDIGIKYTKLYNEKNNSFISGACITQDKDIIICENGSILKKLIYKPMNDKYNVELIEVTLAENIKAIAEYEGIIYLLDNKKKCIITYEGINRESIFLLLPRHEQFIALSISKYGIAVTCRSRKIYFYEDYNFTKIEIDFVEEPIHIEQKKEDLFLVTDSLNHIVYEVDKSGCIQWFFGEKGEPGWNEKSIYMPMCSVYGKDGSIYIAEQRNHRILHITREKKIIKEIGRCLCVGLTNGRLWAPDFVLVDNDKDHVFAVLSKSGTIVQIKDGIYNTIYGYNRINYSIFNFQRSCEWNEHLYKMLVADTGHNRVLVMDEYGKVEKELVSINKLQLQCPRCAVWINDKMLITDSRNKRVILLNAEYELIDEYDFNDFEFCQGSNWLQVAMMDKNCTQLLVSTSIDVKIFDLRNFALIWSSNKSQMKYCDIHCVQFENEEIIITDTGNNRVVFVNNYRNIHILEYVNMDGKQIRLNRPRMAKRVEGGVLIVDSGNSKVYIIDNEYYANILYSSGEKRGMGPNSLSAPRWATLSKNTLFISDTDNHRIVVKKIKGDM